MTEPEHQHDSGQRVALVTGGASGIGEACVEHLASTGMRVVVADLVQGRAQEVADRVGGGSFGLRVDVTEPDSVAAMIQTVRDREGRLDVAVNNAGVGVPEKKLLTEVTANDWRTVM